ncbi:sex hormone-binding globulin isoform X2 [Scleropages formosus]|uniref:sex hormone-binding globulin isoform X2 n=1 Tax=Scleropages formosus TaxID=113540 RepID=UPI000878FF9E|nr:sex hormone-binding globulin isoform X2 [Scleropages formosus]
MDYPSLFLLLCVSLTQFSQGTDNMNGFKNKSTSGTGLLNLGSKSPLMHTKANLSDIRSIKSSFDFRTLDPEGVLLYGDTRGGLDWFVLALRDGLPEMQIGKGDAVAIATGGPRLNDGRWHHVQLRSEGRSVVLEVGGAPVLLVGLHSQHAVEDTAGQIRLSLGGVLVQELEFFTPVQPQMDGCIRAGNWLNHNLTWEIDLREEGPPCFTEIHKGSFFPGTGLALFNTSAFLAHQANRKVVTIEMEGPFAEWSGTALTILTSQHDPVLTITAQNQTEELKVVFREQVVSVPGVHAKLAVNLSRHAVSIESDNAIIAEFQDDTHDWLDRWHEGMALAFGGVPDIADDTTAENGSSYLHGCVGRIRIQEQEVDLDRALYKHSSVSTHSCPASINFLDP